MYQLGCIKAATPTATSFDRGFQIYTFRFFDSTLVITKVNATDNFVDDVADPKLLLKYDI